MAEKEYIEREAVLKAYLDLVLAKSKAEKSKKGAATFQGDLFPMVELTAKEWVRLINAAPAADVAPVRHGRWFDTGVENETGSIYFCSACNKYNNPNKKDVKMRRAKEKPEYCPNCGAKMDLEGR